MQGKYPLNEDTSKRKIESSLSMVNDDKMEIAFIQNHEKQTHVGFKSKRVELGEVGELQYWPEHAEMITANVC